MRKHSYRSVGFVALALFLALRAHAATPTPSATATATMVPCTRPEYALQPRNALSQGVTADCLLTSFKAAWDQDLDMSDALNLGFYIYVAPHGDTSAPNLCVARPSGAGWYAYRPISDFASQSGVHEMEFSDSLVLPYALYSSGGDWDVFFVTKSPYTVLGPINYAAELRPTLHTELLADDPQIEIGAQRIFKTSAAVDDFGGSGSLKCSQPIYQWAYSAGGGAEQEVVTEAPELSLDFGAQPYRCGESFSVRVRAGYRYTINFADIGPKEFEYFYKSYGPEKRYEFWKTPEVAILSPTVPAQVDACDPQDVPVLTSSCGCFRNGALPGPAGQDENGHEQLEWFYSSEAPGHPQFQLSSGLGSSCSDSQSWLLDAESIGFGKNQFFAVVTDAHGTAARSGDMRADSYYRGKLVLNFCGQADAAGAQIEMRAEPLDELNPGPLTVPLDASLSASFTFTRTEQSVSEARFRVTKDLYETYPSGVYAPVPDGAQLDDGTLSLPVAMCAERSVDICLLPRGITLSGRVSNECVGSFLGEPWVPYSDLVLSDDAGYTVATGQTDNFGEFHLWFRPTDTLTRSYKLELSKPGFTMSGSLDVGTLRAGDNRALPDSLKLNSSECEDAHDKCSVPNPLDAQTGGRLLEVTDLQVPGRGGLDFSFTRRFNGLPPVQAEGLGWGWSHNWDVYMLAQREGGYAVHFADNRWHRFLPDGAGGYKATPGFYYRLLTVNNCLELVSPEGLRYRFNPEDKGKLSQLRDRFGNQITLTYHPATPAGPGAGRLFRITDSGGRVYELGYANSGGLDVMASLKYPDPNSGTRTLTYSHSNGELTSVQDSQPGPNAYSATYGYQSGHLLRFKRDPKGPKSYKRVQYSYDSRGRNTELRRLADSALSPVPTPSGTPDISLSYTQDAQGRISTQFSIDGYSRSDGSNTRGQWTGQTVNGVSNSREWDDDNMAPSKLKDFRGNQTTYTYKPGKQGLLDTMVDPLGVITTYSYDALAQPTGRTVYDPKSGITRSYSAITDGFGRMLTVTEGGTDVAQPRVTQYSYDDNGGGQWTGMTDPDGRVFRRVFNAQGLLASHIEVSAGLQTDYTYDALGRVKTVTDQASGLVTTNTYDAAGNVTRVDFDKGSDSSSILSTYDVNGNLLTRQDEELKTTTYVYSQDGKEDLQQVQGPTGTYTRSYTYTPDTHLLQTETLSGSGYSQIRDYSYIQACACSVPGKLQSMVVRNATVNGLPNQALTTAFSYDNDGNRVTVTDPKGTVTKTIYNAANRVTAVTTGFGSATPRTVQYDPDGFGQNLKLTDGKGQITLFKYDALGRLQYERPAAGPDLTFGYSPSGELIQKDDRNGRTWTGHYDGGGRLDEESFEDGAGADQTHSFSYGRNGDGTRQLKQVSDPTGGASFSYGFRERLASATYPGQQRQLSYTHNKAGAPLSLTLKDLSGQSPDKTCSYTPDDLHRTQQFTDWAGNKFSYTYNPANQITGIEIRTAANKLIASGSFLYDPTGQQLNAVYRNAQGVLLAKVEYQYDLAGNRTQRNASYASNSFSYDSQYQLLTEDNSADIRGKQTFTYDLAGNRQTKKMGAATNPSVSYTFGNLLNRVMGQTGGGESNATFGYDGEGNRILKTTVPPPTQDDNGSTQYTWDGKNRLTQVTLSDSTVITYTYDYQNRLVRRVKGIEIRSFVYGQGNQVLEETLNGKRLTLYGWGADGLVSRTDAEGRSLFFLKDALGSVIAVVDDRGAVVQSYEYDAFGLALSGKDAVNAYQFVGGHGGYTDQDTGLIQFWNRWYDPAVGRWISEDPSRRNGGINFYRYVNNRPGNLTDRRGLVADPEDYPTYRKWGGTKTWRLNNPGAFDYIGENGVAYYTRLGGGYRSDDPSERSAKFASEEAGWNALVYLVTHKYGDHDWTIADAINDYAPSSDGNDPENYVKMIGVSGDELVKNHVTRVTERIKTIEGWVEGCIEEK